MVSILLLNFSHQAGDLGSNLVASSKILVAMATKMVLTWRVGWEAVQLALTKSEGDEIEATKQKSIQ